MRKKELALIALLFPLVTTIAGAQTQTITLGKQAGWDNITYLQNISMTEGRQGYLDLTIGNSEYQPDVNTDALFHFDNLSVRDAAGRYRVISSDVLTQTNRPKLGAGAALFQQGGNGIRLAIPRDGFLAPGTTTGDFTIEFWLYPVNLQDNGTILLWRGARQAPSGALLSEQVRIDIHDRHLRFTFQNVFVPPDGGAYQLVIEGRNGLIPRTWHHHLIRFDASTGLFEYVVDDTPEAVTYVTTTGTQGSTVYLPHAGVSSIPELQIGPSFVGMMDEFRIEKSFVTDPNLDPVGDFRGVVESGVLDLQYSHSQVQQIDAETETPGQTAVIFFYRIGDKRSATDVVGSDWIPFTPGTDLTVPTSQSGSTSADSAITTGAGGATGTTSGTSPAAATATAGTSPAAAESGTGGSGGAPTGRYLQIRAELLPDGPRLVAPRLHSVTITYLPDEPPMPPAVIAAQPGNGQVTLKWSAVPEMDVQGYLIYYGEKPSQYFGTDAASGPSPIDVGNVTQFTLSGLTNGKLYYFSVAAYDRSHSQRSSTFSKEVSARPLRIY